MDKMAALLISFLLPLCVLAVAADTNTVLNATLISDACRHTTVNYGLCVKTLSSEPKVKDAQDISGLVSVAIEVASRAAINTSTYVDGLADRINGTVDGPWYQQCLADCAEEYINVAEQLDDAGAALEHKAYPDVIRWVEAAMADVKTCQAGCNNGEGQTNVLTERNGELDKLASIIIALTKLLIQ